MRVQKELWWEEGYRKYSIERAGVREQLRGARDLTLSYRTHRIFNR